MHTGAALFPQSSMISVLLIIIAITLSALYYSNTCKKRRLRRGGPFKSALVDGPEIPALSATFDWKTTKPWKFRPFKPKYNLTMGITRPNHADWLLLEDTYLDRINHHKWAFANYPEETALCSSGSEHAVAELYDYVTQFLVARYPHYFVFDEEKRAIINKILNEAMPASAADAAALGFDSKEIMRKLGEHTEEDFLLLGYDETAGEYRLQACTGIAANGFLWKSRMGMNLTSLHGPIPKYKERLQFSMNKFFRKMQPQDIVQRTTYKVQLSAHDAIFLPQGNVAPSETTDFSQDVHMRLERQQLFRLPRSNFILFTIRTYMYPLSDIKSEGLGQPMADSIRSWPDDFAKYKHRDEWGAPTLRYLEAVS